MGRSTVLKLVVMGAAASTSACSLLFLLTEPPAAEDGTLTVPEASSAVDGAAALAEDGSTDDGARSRACADGATPDILCDDFDDLQGLTARWQSFSPNGRVIKVSDAVTPPFAVQADVRVPPPDASAMAYLSRSVAFPRRFRFEYDVNVVSAPDAGVVQLNRIRLGALKFFLGASGSGRARLITAVNDRFVNLDLFGDLGVGRWRRVSVSVDTDSDPPVFRVAFDGQPVLEQRLRDSLGTVPEVGDVRVGIDSVRSDEPGPWAVLLDNVRLVSE